MKKKSAETKTGFRKLPPFIFLIAVLVPLFLTLRTVIFGFFPFWYDPARDMLLAAANLKKISLIGPPSGIPGIFYGPYWIWFLSLAELLGKDPRIVTFIIQTIPYYVVLPILLYIIGKKMFNRYSIVIVWTLFMFSFIRYTNQLWNPHLAPLIFFGIVMVILHMSFRKIDTSLLFLSGLLGVLQGLLINFHISFGTAIFVSLTFYYLMRLIIVVKERKQLIWRLLTIIISAVCLGIGFMFTMIPTMVFEMRHGFNQIKTLIMTLNKSYIHGTAAVGQVGMSSRQILASLLERATLLLQLPSVLNVVIALIIAILLIGVVVTKKNEINMYQKRFLLFFCAAIAGILVVYLSSKNPVWSYHFVGVEVLFVYVFLVILDHVPFLRKVLFLWATILVVTNYVSALRPVAASADITDLSRMEKNVQFIFYNAQKMPFAYVAKNPAIYTYDYDYLFYWLGTDLYHFVPKNTVTDSSEIVYVIIPKAQLSDKKGFVENRTPEKEYMTVNEWYGIDGTLIIRRQLKNIQTK